MVETVGPMVFGTSRGRTAAALHLAGGTVGGALTGLLAAAGALAVGAVSSRAVELAAVALLLAAGCAALRRDVAGGRSFGLSRQTPKAWRRLLPDGVVAFAYGLDLGLGLSTRMYFGALPLSLLAGLVTTRPGVALGAGVAFGFSRSAAVLVQSRREARIRLTDPAYVLSDMGAARRPYRAASVAADAVVLLAASAVGARLLGG